MRKRIIGQEESAESQESHNWLNLEVLAQVEVTSEAEDQPIEAALGVRAGGGWRAATTGPQTIRLIFDQPQQIRRIRLVFDEWVQSRSQEFVLRWTDGGAKSYREIVRQQYYFSPSGATHEVEEYEVELHAAKLLELEIIPNMGGGTVASLTRLQLA
ncbi:MAG: hypothetical protein HC822_26670 [Oscillochloris sp.]|nr:hypothetical protein [Oscillochloris sp.]